jgi:glycosyltransferase involved in cell wall biosynthesis
MDGRLERIAVVVPALDAEETLGDLLTSIIHIVPPTNIVVINDGSKDSTASVARSHGVNLISNSSNLGKGHALQQGFDMLKINTGIDAVITIDADLQHRCEDIPRFINQQQATGAQLILGCRNRRGTRMPIHRRLSNAITSYLVSARTGIHIPDSQCGYRLIDRRVLESVTTEALGFEAETEFLIKAAGKKWQIGFIPIETLYNSSRSHMRHWHTTLSFIKVLFKDY